MEVIMLKPLNTTCLILTTLLATPATAKDYSSLQDYLHGRATYVSVSIADATGTAVNDGRTWLAIKTVKCGGTLVVLWLEKNDINDYYITTGHKRNGTFPRVNGKFTYNDATEETALNGKPCTNAD
jgi:hypothetical protein